jgi:hypothetical protein
MALSIFLAALILFFGSDSLAQVYKYKDKEGKITYTDNPSSTLVKEDVPPKVEKSKPEVYQRKRSNEDVKDVYQLGEEILEKELAKPPEKQDQRLIQELREALKEGSDKKAQTSKESEHKGWGLFNKLGIGTSKNQ